MFTRCSSSSIGIASTQQIHRHFNDQERATDLLLYGRRMYELMAAYWPYAGDDPSLPDYMREYSEIWREKQKVVFSQTLSEVAWNSRLVRGEAAEEVARLKAGRGGVMSAGGATRGSSLVDAGLVDELSLYVTPVILGAGKPMFGGITSSQECQLNETATFDSGVVLLRYERSRKEEWKR